MRDPAQSTWSVVSLGDSVTLSRGKDLPVQSRTQGQYPVVGSNGIVGYHSSYVAKSPGVLVGRSGSVGEVAWVEQNYWPLNTTLWVTDFHGNDPRFISFFLQHLDLGRFTGGVSVPTLNRNILHRIEVRIPPVAEQRAISNVLETVHEAREERRRELALERERKASLMDYLFSFGTRGERSKKTEIGEIPESWELTSLGELCEDDLGTIQTGPFGSQLHASDYVQTGIPVVNPTHLGFNLIEREQLPHVSEELANSLSKHYLQLGDILISRRGDFSRFAYISSKEAGWLCGTGCMLVRLTNPAIDNYFLALSMSLESIQSYLKQSAVGSIMPNLNTTILSQMPVIVPAIGEQGSIAEILRACEAKVRTLEGELFLLDELLGAMLEELMTGRLSAVPLVEEHQQR
jgi:type I restriction enzyme S subunit